MDLSDIDKFRDPIWRISNLYSIRTRNGKVIPFRPRPQQKQVLEMMFKERLKRIVILKARQLGFSTLLGVICTDQLCWTTGKQLSLIDRTQENARQKASRHRRPRLRLPARRTQSAIHCGPLQRGEFGVRFHEYDQAQTSTLFAGRSPFAPAFAATAWEEPGSSDSILDRFFGKPRRNVRLIR